MIAKQDIYKIKMVYKCEQCQPERVFTSKTAMKIHMKSHNLTESKVIAEQQEKENDKKTKQVLDELEQQNNILEVKNVAIKDLFKKDSVAETAETVVHIKSYKYCLEIVFNGNGAEEGMQNMTNKVAEVIALGKDKQYVAELKKETKENEL